MEKEIINKFESLDEKIDMILGLLNAKPLTVRGYAEKYGIHENTVRRNMKEGSLDYKLIGRTKYPIG